MLSSSTSARPGPWSCAVRGSFARRSMEERVPRILEDTADKNAFRPEIDRAVRALAASST